MIKLKTLCIEAFVPNKNEFDAAVARSEYKIIDIYMDRGGKVFIDDREVATSIPDPKDVSARITLDFNNNKVRIYQTKVHGNKIEAGTQQLLSAILKNGIINTSWKVDFGDTEGWYKNSKYVHTAGAYQNLPPNFWKRNTRIDVGENLTMYHGTSEKELPTILKYGLRPLGMKHTERGAESRVRLEENTDFLYLAGTFMGAMNYAKTKARWNMRSEDPTKYSWVEHWEWERWFIKPVVLLVRIPDFTKLRSDDDRVISLIKDKAYKLWEIISPEEKEKQKEMSAKWYQERGIKYTPNDISPYTWVTSDNGLDFVLKQFDKSEWNNWKKSLEDNNQIGYKGIIPPSHISIVDLEKTYQKDDK